MIRNVKNGDIKTSGTQFETGENEVAQAIRARLRMFLGESFIDVRKGTPWFQSILGKTPQDVAEVNVKRRILTAPGVDQLLKFNFEADLGRRTLTISATVLTADGTQSSVTVGDEVLT